MEMSGSLRYEELDFDRASFRPVRKAITQVYRYARRQGDACVHNRTLPEASHRALEIRAAAYARHYAGLAVAARANGRDFPAPDGYIAAIAASRRFAVAARDPNEFVTGGRSVIDREACRIAVGLGELARQEQAGL
jgi:hypothetical protein